MNTFVKNLADLLSLDAETLAKAVQSSEEPTIELPKGKFHLDSDIEEMKENFRKEKSKSYEEGKVAGTEIATKTFSRASGLETIRDPDEFVKAISKKIAEEAKIEPNKKVEELNLSLSNLQKMLAESENKYADLQANLKEEAYNRRILGKIPDSVTDFGLTKDDALLLYKSSRKISDDGIEVNGKILKDAYEKPIPIEMDVESFIKDKGWVSKQKGRSEHNNFTAPKTFAEYEELLKQKGLNPGSMEANQLLNTLAKENPEILK